MLELAKPVPGDCCMLAALGVVENVIQDGELRELVRNCLRLRLEISERRAALSSVLLVYHDNRLLVKGRGPHLAPAVFGGKVAPREEDEHNSTGLHVLLQERDVFQIVDIKEDAHARQTKLQLPLDDSHLVLSCPPHVAEEEVVPQSSGQRRQNWWLARADESQRPRRADGDPRQLVGSKQQQKTDDDGRKDEEEEKDTVALVAEAELFAHLAVAVTHLEEQDGQEDEQQCKVKHHAQPVVLGATERMHRHLKQQETGAE
eukprot:3130360-Pleurochrysis_carterae.AAC.2